MPYTNTRDVLGDQETFDAIIRHDNSLSSFCDDAIVNLKSRAFYKREHLVNLILPSVTTIFQGSVFSDCPNLEVIDMLGGGQIFSGGLSLCPKLKGLFLRNEESISTMGSSGSDLRETTIHCLKGGVYVPSSMVSLYKSNANWSVYLLPAIRSIEEYPVTDFSTINMTWTQIKAAIDDESFFSMGYVVGDVKKLIYGDGNSDDKEVYVEIKKIDSTNKYVDFIVRDTAETCAESTSAVSASIRTENTVLYSRLNDIYNNELPSDLKNVITPVTKQYWQAANDFSELTCYLWLLNLTDAGVTGEGSNSNYFKNEQGNPYFVNSAYWRYKHLLSTLKCTDYWLGTKASDTAFYYVSYSGSINTKGTANTKYGLVFGFRIQKTQS